MTEEQIRTEDRVQYTITDGVADVRMVRVDKMNALDDAMFEALVTVGKEIAADTSVRAVVLSGEGRAFCSGLDFGRFEAMKKGVQRIIDEREPLGPAKVMGQQSPYVWTWMPVPVIAAVHGFAFGGGCQVAMGADIRIVHPDTKMSLMEAKWGLVPDMTGTQMIAGLVRRDIAKELVYTGRIVSGTEAAEIGLATRTSENPYEDAMALAKEIASKSPHSVRRAKELMELSGRVSLEEGFAAEQKAIRSLIGTPNQKEAVSAGMEKRDPVYADYTPVEGYDA
ncbi:crotonase/enoyl-CoA hydratase family protein [Cumulibacter manganitolerans]|uniref:crotonase/enoyl-CoA hydratase family protein n=1 Tax=Cumulibacter manganitolerans TaxID=1884992 RepID=UPI001298031C|nr:crotonase/enoyl-CoA hydratase family protein [Cumulibacter manganitolerans]